MQLRPSRFRFLAVSLACAVIARTAIAADEQEKETDEKGGMKFDFGSMFDGLKDALKIGGGDGDMGKFADLFGDLSHLKDLFGKDGDGGGDALKNLDLSKLFDGVKDKKGGAKNKDKKGKDATDCDAFEPMLACNSTTGTCDECGPGVMCNVTTGMGGGCCDPYQCQELIETGDGNRRLSGEGEKGEHIVIETRCCATTMGPSCGKEDDNCCNPDDSCLKTSKKDFGQSIPQTTCCRRFATSCDSAAECCPPSKGEFSESSCEEGLCCINEGSSCDSGPGGGSKNRNCCGNSNKGFAANNCLKIERINGGTALCGPCRQPEQDCFKNSDCCDPKMQDKKGGNVCIGAADNSTGKFPGLCGACRTLGEPCTRVTPSKVNKECCNRPGDPSRVKCEEVKINGTKTEDTVCCVGFEGACEEDEDCCQLAFNPPDLIRACVNSTCLTVEPPDEILKDIGSDRRRLSGSAGPVGVEASSSALVGLPLNAQNRTNPHSSEAKREMMKQSKEKRKRKRSPAKAPWLDHLFGFSLAFSQDCSLLAEYSVGEPGTDEQQGAVSVYRLRRPVDDLSEANEKGSNSSPFTFATRPARLLVTRGDPPLSGRRLSWSADPTKDRVTLETRRLTLSPPKRDESRQVDIEAVRVDLAPPRRRFRPRGRDRGGKALFGSAVTQCSAPVAAGSDEFVHFLAVSAPGSWHGNVYVYVLTEGQAGGSMTGSVGDQRAGGFGYEIVQELVSQGGKGPYDFLQRLSLRDAGGFGEARMGQTVKFEIKENSEEMLLLTTEQREGAQAYGFKMGTKETEPVWPPFSRLSPAQMEVLNTESDVALPGLASLVA
uniref:Disintegrin domain-containing protein n=1 Tax=Chromera velia CCMP2878 TaxID=1169474 RepID=A0A0G4FD71_9ALVE|eukprot:Cvel_16455.t1-p1 / transcript=Cvel_16455.t1 / gene=Cvel_16455 / organism=Chromera_velia_CCMP2878 / gene_product=hypothetical protein / transcript_product=hypothetical protein / location=Cvel_scaffold1268:29239-35330(+) / protein_length=828 / sequence_SO=supercontig / SO=protein_coding / is_pseudo=false